MNQNPPPQTPFSPPPQTQMVQVAMPNVRPTVTYGILGVTIFVYLLQLAGNYLLGQDLAALLGMKINSLIRAGQIWRLITPVFLHDSTLPYGLLHIGFNMYALVVFGAGLERYFGHWRFLLLYVLAGFTGNVLIVMA